MEYNTQRKQLVIAEYGRVIQNMVSELLTIEDRERRNRHAKAVINQMAQLTPRELRDAIDFKQKLWDHLYIISDYKLDVDSPYPLPEPGSLQLKPDIVPYPSRTVNYRYYGTIVESMIKKVRAIEEPIAREAGARAVATYMKRMYLMWNRDSVTDEIIINHLDEMSNGELKLSPEQGLSNANMTRGSNASNGGGSSTNTGRPYNKNFQKGGGGGQHKKFFNKNQNRKTF